MSILAKLIGMVLLWCEVVITETDVGPIEFDLENQILFTEIQSGSFCDLLTADKN